jgi:hypothetical protein
MPFIKNIVRNSPAYRRKAIRSAEPRWILATTHTERLL